MVLETAYNGEAIRAMLDGLKGWEKRALAEATECEEAWRRGIGIADEVHRLAESADNRLRLAIRPRGEDGEDGK